MSVSNSGYAVMDTAEKFKPKTILLWEKVADHPEARRILALFASAQVHMIRQQRKRALPHTSLSQALLAGKRTLMIGQTSSFVGHFDGWLGSNIGCRPYCRLVPVSNGCPYFCTYCYLAFVYRKYSLFIKMNINYSTMLNQIRKTLARTQSKVSFNMGEMLDSLELDHITNLTTMLVPLFATLSRGFLMLLTKSSNIDNLLAIEPNEQTIISWSLNRQHMIATHEPGIASLGQRIDAGKRCQEHGYRIRLRIDPGILYPNWRAGYADLIESALTALRPENITLGMLRLLPGHLRFATLAYGDWAQKLQDHHLVPGASDGKLRYPPQQRIEFYRFLIDLMRSFNRNVSISLCRETTEIRSLLKDHCDLNKCNCVRW